MLEKHSLNTDLYLLTIEKKMKKGFYTNIEQETLENQNFRKVLYTAKGLQLVLKALQPNEDI